LNVRPTTQLNGSLWPTPARRRPAGEGSHSPGRVGQLPTQSRRLCSVAPGGG
jgi:hypothetical protein